MMVAETFSNFAKSKAAVQDSPSPLPVLYPSPLFEDLVLPILQIFRLALYMITSPSDQVFVFIAHAEIASENSTLQTLTTILRQ